MAQLHRNEFPWVLIRDIVGKFPAGENFLGSIVAIWVEHHLRKEIHNSSFSFISCYPWNTTKACCGLNTCVRRNANYLRNLSMTQVTLDSGAWGMANAWAYAQKRGLSGCLQQEQYPLVISLFTPNTQVHHYHLSRIWDPGKTNKPKKKKAL